MFLVAKEQKTYCETASETMWQKVVQKELEVIVKNKTLTIANLPPEHKPIGLNWVFKLKKNSDGVFIKHKARLVAKGYLPQQ